MSKKVQAVIYGLDDASPSDIDKALAARKSMWRSLNFKLWLIILLLAANLASDFVFDMISTITTLLGV